MEYINNVVGILDHCITCCSREERVQTVQRAGVTINIGPLCIFACMESIFDNNLILLGLPPIPGLSVPEAPVEDLL